MGDIQPTTLVAAVPAILVVCGSRSDGCAGDGDAGADDHRQPLRLSGAQSPEERGDALSAAVVVYRWKHTQKSIVCGDFVAANVLLQPPMDEAGIDCGAVVCSRLKRIYRRAVVAERGGGLSVGVQESQQPSVIVDGRARVGPSVRQAWVGVRGAHLLKTATYVRHDFLVHFAGDRRAERGRRRELVERTFNTTIRRIIARRRGSGGGSCGGLNISSSDAGDEAAGRADEPNRVSNRHQRRDGGWREGGTVKSRDDYIFRPRQQTRGAELLHFRGCHLSAAATLFFLVGSAIDGNDRRAVLLDNELTQNIGAAPRRDG